MNFEKSIALTTLITSSAFISSLSLNLLNKSILNKYTNNYINLLNGFIFGYSTVAFFIFSNYALNNYDCKNNL